MSAALSRPVWRYICFQDHWAPPQWRDIAVFPVLADVVEVKTGFRLTAHWRIHFIRSNGWLGNSFAQMITLLDIDGIGQNWEGSNIITTNPQGN